MTMIIIKMMMMMMMMIVVSRGRLTPVELVVRWWEVKPEEAHMLTMFGRDHSVIITAIVMMIGMDMMMIGMDMKTIGMDMMTIGMDMMTIGMDMMMTMAKMNVDLSIERAVDQSLCATK